MIECLEWLLKECKRIALQLSKRPEDADDTASEVIAYFIANKKQALSVYEQRNYQYLYGMIKRRLYENYSKRFFADVKDYGRYKRIMGVCEQYDIAAVPDNAYKISALIQDNHNEYTIQNVANILEAAQYNIPQNGVSISECYNI